MTLSESIKQFYEFRRGEGSLGEILHSIRFSLARERGDSLDLNGVLFLEDHPPGGDSVGNLEVFVKRMWVCERQQSLLPEWASFLSGIIVTPDLRRMVARDELDTEHKSF